MKNKLIIFLVLLSVLVGCSTTDKPYDFHGTIVHKEDGRLLIVKTIETFDDKENSVDEILKEGSDAIWVKVSEKDYKNFVVGGRVAVWTNGKIEDSYPQQTTAKMIAALAD